MNSDRLDLDRIKWSAANRWSKGPIGDPVTDVEVLLAEVERLTGQVATLERGLGALGRIQTKCDHSVEIDYGYGLRCADCDALLDASHAQEGTDRE